MQHTKIEWVKNEDGTQGYTINPVKGLCPMACPYCYARAMYKRFKWNPEIRYEEETFLTLGQTSIGSKIFVGSTMELFLPQFENYTRRILHICSQWDDRKFLFLTKQPQNLIKFSPFPDNCWVGVTATNRHMAHNATAFLHDIKASVKFISFEPLLGWNIDPVSLEQSIYGGLTYAGINWIIIGQQTPISKKTSPKIEWVRDIVEAADRAGIPVFLKDNLFPILPEKTQNEIWGQVTLRQEMPKC